MFIAGDSPVPVPDALARVIEIADYMSIIAAQRLERIDAMHREAVAEAAAFGRDLTPVVERGIRLELAAALRVTEYVADDLLQLAEALVQRYPSVLDSLAGARVTEQHARILVSSLDAVEPELRGILLPDALAEAEAQPVGTFRRRLRAMIDAARSVTLARRHEGALAHRRVAIEPAEDGMAWLHALIPAVEAHAIHSRVTAMAKAIASHPDESRSLDQTRADVVCDLLIEGDTAVHPAEARGVRATVAVTVPALALLAADDDERDRRGLAPASVEGIGPIPLDEAKRLCAGAEGWMRVLTHPETGAVLSVGRDQYRPPPGMRRLIRWRAGRCMAPGCGVPASRCEIDHTIAWQDGGPTSLFNAAPLCTGHHTVKHHGGWTVEQVPGSGGALLWTSPAGRRYLVQPERPLPVFRPSSAADAPF